MKTLVLFLLVLTAELVKESAAKLVVREDKPKEIHEKALKKKDFDNPLYLFQKYDWNFIMNKL